MTVKGRVNPITFQAFSATVQISPSGLAIFKRPKVTKPDSIYQVMARQKRLILAKDAAALERMAGAWKVAQAGIEGRLAAVIERIERAQATGADISPAWLFQQDRYTELLTEIGKQVGRYADSAGDEAVEMQRTNFQDGADHARELVASAGVRYGFKSLAKGAFENQVGFLSDGSPLVDLFAELGPSAVSRAREVFAVGIANGSNAKVMARELRQSMELTKRRAELIARTESARAYVTAQKDSYDANTDVVEGSRWVSARDSRTCPLCWARDGQILKKGETPAMHPGCRCGLAPVVKYVQPSRKTGEQILTELEAANPGYALEILGPARYDLWKSGQIGLMDMVKEVDHPRWGPGIRSRRLDEIQEDIDAGRAGRKIPPIKARDGGKTPKVDLMAPEPEVTADRVMSRPIVVSQGANGLYMGADGVRRQITVYEDEGGAYRDHVATQVARGMGQPVANTTVFRHRGRTALAREVDNVEAPTGAAAVISDALNSMESNFPLDLSTVDPSRATPEDVAKLLALRRRVNGWRNFVLKETRGWYEPEQDRTTDAMVGLVDLLRASTSGSKRKLK